MVIVVVKALILVTNYIASLVHTVARLMDLIPAQHVVVDVFPVVLITMHYFAINAVLDFN
jgi:hypothetical protein